MASAILSSFPRPPTHVPPGGNTPLTSPLPLDKSLNRQSTDYPFPKQASSGLTSPLVSPTAFPRLSQPLSRLRDSTLTDSVYSVASIGSNYSAPHSTNSHSSNSSGSAASHSRTGIRSKRSPHANRLSFAGPPPTAPLPPLPAEDDEIDPEKEMEALKKWRSVNSGDVRRLSKGEYTVNGGLDALARLAAGSPTSSASHEKDIRRGSYGIPALTTTTKDQRRISGSSFVSTASTSTRAFKKSGMKVSAEELETEDGAEMAGERLLGAVEGLMFKGGKKLGLPGSSESSRPSSGSLTGSVTGSGSTGSPTTAKFPTSITSTVIKPSKTHSAHPSTSTFGHGFGTSGFRDYEDVPLPNPLPSPTFTSSSHASSNTVTSGPTPNFHLPMHPSSSQNGRTSREKSYQMYGGSASDDGEGTMESFEESRVGSGSNFAQLARRSMGLTSVRDSVGSVYSQRSTYYAQPDYHLEDMGAQTPRIASGQLPQYAGKLVNVQVWDDAPLTAQLSPGAGWGGEIQVIGTVEAGLGAQRAGVSGPSSIAFPSGDALTPTNGSMNTPRPQLDRPWAKSPGLSTPRPDSAGSNGSKRKVAPPPALSLSRATPLSSQTSLVLDYDEPYTESPSKARQFRITHAQDVEKQMEKEMDTGVVRGEFAFLQEVAVREKRLKLAMFGRGPPPKGRPKSIGHVEKALPGTPRDDGASSPEIGEMIRRGRQSLSAKRSRRNLRRRSTGALGPVDLDYDMVDQWREATAMQPEQQQGTPEQQPKVELNEDEDDNETFDGEDSDSSLDLHTPLPKLMLKAGMLSPHSKILRPPTPELDKRASISSSKTLKVPKDGRDTAKRKRRHRDGKMLREGVGLTTGLGWSDSEDEDAPSALTRRLSSMTLVSALSRKASMASSMNSFYAGSMSSVHLARSPSLPQIPSYPNQISSSASSSKVNLSNEVSRHAVDPNRRPSITGILKSASTQSLSEHARLPSALKLNGTRHHTAIGLSTNRTESPEGSSQSSGGGRGSTFPITPDSDMALSPAHGGVIPGILKAPVEVNGGSGFSMAGHGLAGLSRGRSYTSPPSPTPTSAQNAALKKALEKAPDVRYSGGNFSYPTFMRTPNGSPSTPGTPVEGKPVDVAERKGDSPPIVLASKKPTSSRLQPLTLPTVVAAGGRLSPRAGGAFSLPPAGSSLPTITPKKTAIPLGNSSARSSGQSNYGTAPPSAFNRKRSGSTSSNGSPPRAAAVAPAKTPVVSRVPQPVSTRNRTLSGTSNSGLARPVSASRPVPPTPTAPLSSLPSPSVRAKKHLGPLKGAASVSDNKVFAPVTPGITRALSAPGGNPGKLAAASVLAKTGAGMAYRTNSGTTMGTTPIGGLAKSGLSLPNSGSRLAAPSAYSLSRRSSSSSLNSSVVGVAL